MSKLKNLNVDIFPISFARNDPTARILNEPNIRGMLKGLCEKPSFVISFNNPHIEFYIEGYHCIVTLSDELLDSETGTKIYVKLSYNDQDLIDHNEDATAAEEDFIGMEFSTTVPSGTGFLQLLTRPNTSSPWSVPKESFYRFGKASLDLDGLELDGGLIT